MNRLQNFFFPPRCLLCGVSRGLLNGIHLCRACFADVHINDLPCVCCGVPLISSGLSADENICGACLAQPPAFDHCWSPFVYAQPLEWMIQQFKFNARLMYAPLLSGLMIRQMPAAIPASSTGINSKPEAIIPMPLHPSRLKQRGFNQSLLLAQPLAKVSGLIVDTVCCERVRDTEHQTGKTASQRKSNISAAFSFNNRRNYQHVVILDDVVTTGASVSELTRVLKRAGVSRVDVWCLARAEKNY